MLLTVTTESRQSFVKEMTFQKLAILHTLWLNLELQQKNDLKMF